MSTHHFRPGNWATRNPIAACLWQCRGLIGIAVLFGFGINLLMLAVPLYSMQVFDRVLSSGSQETLVFLSLIVVVCLVFTSMLQALRELLLTQTGRWIEDHLQDTVFRATAETSVVQPGIGAQPLRDLATVKGFVSSMAFVAAVDAPWAPIYFICVYIISIPIGVALSLSACVFIALALAAHYLPKSASERSGQLQTQALQTFDAMLRNAEITKAMGLVRNASQRWKDENCAAVEAAFSATNLGTLIGTVTRGLRTGLQLFLTGFSAWLVLSGHLSSGAIIAVSTLAGKALAPFDSAVSIHHGWSGFKLAYRRLVDIVSIAQHEPPKIRLPAPSGILSVESLSWQERQGQRWILRGVTFHLDAGCSLAVIGPSGSGKTTLARLLVGLMRPTIGHVRLDHAALEQWPPEQLGEAIGYLPQDVQLFSGTVAQNIARLDRNPDSDGVVAAAVMAGIHDLVLHLPHGYQTDIGVNGRTLSAGQRQRIALARCFYGHPKLMVLDEPNASLDREGEHALALALERAKKAGITTITISHRTRLLRQMDRILLLTAGEVRAYGAPSNILPKLVDPTQTIGASATPRSATVSRPPATVVP